MTALSLTFLLNTLAIVVLGIYSQPFARKRADDFLLADRGLGLRWRL